MDMRKGIISSINRIPLISKSATQLLEIISRPDYSMTDIKPVVENDSILSARILKVVNSAAFGLSNQITSVERAIPFLGEKMLAAIALEISVTQIYSKQMAGYESKQGELWEHSLKTALAAKMLVKYAREKIDEGTAYTCGVVHDLGKSVLSTYLALRTDMINEKLEELESGDYLEVEKSILNIDHSEAGEMLARHWALPEIFCEVILHHHKPAECSESFRPICYLIHIADIIAMLSGGGTGMDGLYYTPDPRFRDYIDLSEEALEKVMLTVSEDFIKINQATSS